jgi:hypothetical protein
MATISVTTNKLELVNSKFINTIAVLEGYRKEAIGDIQVRQRYTAQGVANRMNAIKEAFDKDLANLASEITITG